MMKKFFSYCVLMFLTLTAQSYAAGDADAGASKVATCTACHGQDGNSTIRANPKLAGQNASYLIEQLKAFRTAASNPKEGRQDPIMPSLVQNLSDQDIEDIAAYYASQETQMGSVDKELLELGQAIYRGGDMANGIAACTACHGANGQGLAQAGFPKLSGQHAEYTIKQLKAFADCKIDSAGVVTKKCARTNDMNAMMRDIAKKMNDAQIKAVASYIEGLH